MIRRDKSQEHSIRNELPEAESSNINENAYSEDVEQIRTSTPIELESDGPQRRIRNVIDEELQFNLDRLAQQIYLELNNSD